MVFDNFFNSILGPFIETAPLTTLIIISFVITLIVTIAYKYLTNQELMKTLKEDGKKLQAEMKNNKDNTAKMLEIQKQAMEKNMKYMMHSFTPTFITFIPLLIIFTWLRNAYKDLNLNFLGLIDNWIWAYIIVSIVASIILRKLLKVH